MLEPTRGHWDNASTVATTSRLRDLTPSSSIPLAYFALAHAGLALALAILALRPDTAGAFFFHPRMVALVHLVTLVWLSGSILGAFYIAAPLALGLPMAAGRSDWIAFVAFALGTSMMVIAFWFGRYDAVAWSASCVTAAIGWVAIRAWRGLAGATAPWPIRLHVGLAFFNILAAAGLGMAMGLDRTRGFLGISPLAAAYAHAHLAAVGWVTMMVAGLGLRLIPMMLPAAMPTGRSLSLSAVLMQAGVIVVAFSLIRQSAWLPVGAALVGAGLASFVVQIRRALAHRMPKPPALPRRDWSTWQACVALGWLIVSVLLGLVLSADVLQAQRVPLSWCYGVAGLVGFLAQMVVGVQGRLVPMYAWYRAKAARGGTPPARAANELPSEPFARVIFVSWAVGVPCLAWGLAQQRLTAVAGGAAALFCGVSTGAAYLAYMLYRAR